MGKSKMKTKQNTHKKKIINILGELREDTAIEEKSYWSRKAKINQRAIKSKNFQRTANHF